MNSKKERKIMGVFFGVFILFVVISNYNVIKSISNFSASYSLAEVSKSGNSMVWSEATNISMIDGIGSFEAEIAIDSEGNIHVVWYEDIGIRYEIKYRRYDFQEKLWKPIEIVSNTSANKNSFYPKITVDRNDKLHLVWRESSPCRLLYKFFNGTSWSKDYEFTQCNETIGGFDVIADASSTAYFVWNDRAGYNFELFFRNFSTTTKELSSIIQLTNSSWRSESPKLAFNSQEEIYIVWEDKGVNYNITEVWFNTFNGTTWDNQTATMVSKDDNYSSSNPVLAVDKDDNVYISWHEYVDSYEVHFRSKVNNTWYNELQLSGVHSASFPDICINNDNTLYVVWDDSQGIAYKEWKNQTQWTNTTYPVNNEAILIFPRIVVDLDSRVHIVWNDFSRNNGWEIYCISRCLAPNSNTSQTFIILAISIPVFSFLIVIGISIRMRTKKSDFGRKK